MAAEAGVSVGQIAKSVQVHELGRSQEVIDGTKTVNEILREEGLMPEKKKKVDTYGQAVRLLPKLTIDELANLFSEIRAELNSRQEKEKTS